MDEETERRILHELAQQQLNRKEDWVRCIRLIKDVALTELTRAITFLAAMGIGGAIYGWHLPENVRKIIADWFRP